MTGNRSPDLMTLQGAEQLYNVLRGGPLPDGISIGGRPRLSARAAFGVIYLLQEHYRVIPDIFEQCCRCFEMYNSEESGHYDDKTGRHYCDVCVPSKVRT